ncbi:hypothetical protein S40285_02778 [Stachybotrys chlorohalonatus IBT 40285]|uniref:Hypercellular protein HypA n=1 Tax=Stachybotrys chlorohalonatus (strain IBT 40285) TaxID=1283841 RepID=A0A084QAJ4_STAC4|nr:hypothetical protein S40285_02778 [Stachybotrys chlorohalonata IBT 40285]
MSSDPLLPIAPARVRALLLPLGQIKGDRFSAFAARLRSEHVVRLREISADGRPNRNMFSPLAYPDGAIIYDLINHVPPASHLALSPFDLYREPLAVVALADGKELHDAAFTKRHSVNGTGRTVVEKNIRALYQELEELRDDYPKAYVHSVLIFDYVSPGVEEIRIPEGIKTIPPPEQCKRTTIKTVMCDISSLLLAEMTTHARAYEGQAHIESPGHYSVARLASWDEDDPTKRLHRRNSQFAIPGQSGRSSSAAGVLDKNMSRMSMPPGPFRPPVHSSSSTPGRPSTPIRGSKASSSTDGLNGTSSNPSSPEQRVSIPDAVEAMRDASRDRVSVQGFGSGGANDKLRLRGKSRVTIIIGSMYLQAGRWTDALKELMEGAAAARALNDHIWHGKALELIVICLFLLGWSGQEFHVPTICLPPQERPNSSQGKMEPEIVDPHQPRCLRYLQTLLPELLDRILGLYSKVSSENLPPLPLSEVTIRFSKMLAAIHICNGQLNQKSLDVIVTGKVPTQYLTTSPRHLVTPTRQQIIHLLFKAFPSSRTELLTNVDRVSILSGIAAVLGPLGFHRKKAMVMRELVSVLIGGLIEARTRGAAEAGIHPAAGIVSLSAGNDHGSGSSPLDVGELGVEKGLEAFLGVLCKSYGVIGFDMTESKKVNPSSPAKVETDEAIIARIRAQSDARLFGFPGIKLNVLRACINFSEAMPDFNSVLRYSSDLLRTAGSGVVPGPRRENASAVIHAEEQARLASNITRVSSLISRLGLADMTAEYWDEFLVRELMLEPLAVSRKPIPHARSALPGAVAGRSSQDINPFIYNPFLKATEEEADDDNLVANDTATFRVTLQNTYDIEVDIESIRLCTEGADFEALPEKTTLGPYRTQQLRLRGVPKAEGSIKVTGALVKVQGCRERRFPIFKRRYVPERRDKIKATGLAGLEESLSMTAANLPPLEAETLNLNVIKSQPLVIVKSTTLPQCAVMLLEGERKVFSVTLQNLSSTSVDFMLFSFKDSTQDALQAALSNKDATPAELYEFELILMKKQALRLPNSNQGRNIAPGGEATFEFEIFGKPGLTSATIQVDYTHLGVPPDEVAKQFFTRRVSVDLTVTVNASVDLARFDTLPVSGALPQALLTGAPQENEHCLLLMDLRNAWPSQIIARFESDDGIVVEESILPGNTNRIIFPVKRVYLEDPHAAIPTLNPSRNRQFVVSTSKISPDMERSNREAFWYRETVLDRIKATWRTTTKPLRSGSIELRTIRLTPRMIEAVKVDEIDIDVSVDAESDNGASAGNVAYVDEFMQMKVRITNRTNRSMVPLVRLVPALRHRPSNISLDFVRKFAWNGTLQQLLPELGGHSSVDLVLGITALCRGEFEVTATVEEVRVWEEAKGVAAPDAAKARPRSNTETLMEAALLARERRMWHSREPCVLTVKDRE